MEGREVDQDEDDAGVLIKLTEYPDHGGPAPLTGSHPSSTTSLAIRLSSLAYLQHASCFMVTWSRAFHAL